MNTPLQQAITRISESYNDGAGYIEQWISTYGRSKNPREIADFLYNAIMAYLDSSLPEERKALETAYNEGAEYGKSFDGQNLRDGESYFNATFGQ